MGPAASPEWVADVAELAGLAVAGRILLAWLPPGRPGSHQGREIVATWAASHLLGLAGLTIGGELAARIGLAPRTALIVACVTLGLLLVARIVTSPAGLVPRHEPAPVRWSWGSRILLLACVATVAWVPAGSGPPWSDSLTLASAIATLVFVAYGLALACAPAWLQAVACAAFAAFVAISPTARWEVRPVILATTAAAAGAIGWLRRADARALALAAIAVGYAASERTSGSAVAVALALWIVIGTPRAARLRAAAWCGAGCSIGLAVSLPHDRTDTAFLVEPLPVTRWIPFMLLALVVAGIVAGWLSDRRRTTGVWNASGAARGHEGRVLLGAIVTAFALATLSLRFARELDTSLPLAPGWVLFGIVGGLGLTRWVVERPEAT